MTKIQWNDKQTDDFNTKRDEGASGLTKREYFAALVASGLAADQTCNESASEFIATKAVEVADALIAKLNGK